MAIKNPTSTFTNVEAALKKVCQDLGYSDERRALTSHADELHPQALKQAMMQELLTGRIRLV